MPCHDSVLRFARHEFWRRKYRSARGREYLLMSMRHWLASVLAREKPALFRRLPDDFKIGRPLPPHPAPLTGRVRRKAVRGPIFVHGCELLAV